MISCAASFCPFRFVATHVCMLRCRVPGFWLLRPIEYRRHVLSSSVHILVPAKVALCSLRTGLYLCECNAVISTVLAIQWTPQALSALNTCNYSLTILPQLISPSSPFLPLPLPYLSAHIFLWLAHRKEKGLTSTKRRKVGKDRDARSVIKKDIKKIKWERARTREWNIIMRNIYMVLVIKRFLFFYFYEAYATWYSWDSQRELINTSGC